MPSLPNIATPAREAPPLRQVKKWHWSVIIGIGWLHCHTSHGHGSSSMATVIILAFSPGR